MPRIIEYPVVLRALRDRGLRCLYHNSGAFGFGPTVRTFSAGWIGPPDPTIRPLALPFIRQVPSPHAANLLRLAEAARRSIGGPAWLMPMSHWAYELEFGNADWLPDSLRAIAIDPAALAGRNQADAIEFLPDESTAFAAMIGDLLNHLANSDFALVFPAGPIVATIHHHRQIWWTSSEAALIGKIEG